jgi:cytochrome c-type biogenesis protein CcmE
MCVSLTGYPPDNLMEKREVVAEGYLEDRHHLRADRVLTRCASKYASPNSDSAECESKALTPRGS